MLAPIVVLSVTLPSTPQILLGALVLSLGIGMSSRGRTTLGAVAILVGSLALSFVGADGRGHSLTTPDGTLWLLLGLVTVSLFVTVRWAIACALLLLVGQAAANHLVRGFPPEEVLRQAAVFSLWLVAAVGLSVIRAWERGVLDATLSELEHSRETYSSIVEHQTAMVSRYRPSDHTLTFVNSAYAQRFGKRPEELVGTSFLALIPEEDHAAVREFVAALTPNSEPPAIDHRTLDATGEPSWIRWIDRPVRIERGRVIEIQSIGYDVSELRQALTVITHSHQRISRQQAQVSRLSRLVHRLDRRAISHEVALAAATEIAGTHVEVSDFSDNGHEVRVVADSRWPQPRDPIVAPPGRHPLAAVEFSSHDDLEPLNSSEAESPERSPLELEYDGQNLLAVPIFAEGRWRGALIAYGAPGDPAWSSQDRAFVVALAAVLTISLERDRRQQLHDELNARNQYLAALNDLIPRLLAQEDSQCLLLEIVQAAGRLIGTDHGYLCLATDGQLVEHVSTGLHTTKRGWRLAMGEGVAGRALELRMAFTVDSYASWPGRLDNLVEQGVRALAAVPLIAGEEALGVLGLSLTSTDRTFGRLELLVLRQFADVAALVLHRARLREKISHELEIRRRAEAEVRKLADDLEVRVHERTADLARAHGALRRSETLSAVGALVAGVAHEVRNPLFAMSASLDAFEEEFRNDPQVAEYSVHFRREMTRLEALMRQLLDYARPESVQLSEQSLPDTVRQSAANCRALAQRLGVALRVDRLPPASAEFAAARLQQALQNLIENALQHSAVGSEVTISLLRSPDGAEWWVSIRDHGPGFRTDDLPHIFEPFFTRRRGGTGLGLSIAQRIIEQQRGRIELRNCDDGGAEARLVLPICHRTLS